MNLFLNILTIAAFALSVYNFVYSVISNRKKVDIFLDKIYPLNLNDKNSAYALRFTISNKSQLPISITKLAISDGSVTHNVEYDSKIIMEINNHKGTELLNQRIIRSTSFPLSLQGLEASGNLFKLSTTSESFLLPYQKIIIFIYTNRGNLQKEIEVPIFSDVKQLLQQKE
ncbi:hypothetical protein [Anaeromassilibacillus senegalensis]|uniref:hypothetical protein n=1 Tax=Anaeromassilibacillus senegalensis TaxID=1673717 RepID=UPI000680F671|nr:hypothetical protein [Anaeromassilibacillus senegalensis]